jgi:single-strand DNA-binding protein
MIKLNEVLLVGAIVRDGELKYTPSGTAILEVTVGGNDTVVGSDMSVKSLPWYHRCSIMGKRAEELADVTQAGRVIMVQGSLDYRTWEKDGQKRSLLGVKVQGIEFVDVANPDLIQDSSGGYRLNNAINRVTISGNTTKDSEVKVVPSGDSVASFGVAVNDSWKDKAGEWQEKTHFVDIAAWRSVAEVVGDLTKGSPVIIQGRLVNESWTDKDGNKRNTTKIEAQRAVPLLKKGAATSSGKVDTTQIPEEDLPF